MATSAAFTATLEFTGSDTGKKTLSAATNTSSPAYDMFVTLASGANTITAPTAATATRCTIIPPSGNTVLLTLKGVTGDTGVPLHKTDPTSFGVDSTLVSFCLTAASSCAGVRIIFS